MISPLRVTPSNVAAFTIAFLNVIGPNLAGSNALFATLALLALLAPPVRFALLVALAPPVRLALLVALVDSVPLVGSVRSVKSSAAATGLDPSSGLRLAVDRAVSFVPPFLYGSPMDEPAQSTDSVLYDKSGHVVTITYNRPEALNAINADVRRSLNNAFAEFRDDEDAWVGVVTGAGRAFCAGADLRDGSGSMGEFPGSFWEKPTLNSFESGWEIYKPVIAAVNGHCLGYGLTLVTWCDFVLASDRATFGYPEVTIGVPAMVGAMRLPGRLAWADAMELLLIGEAIDAQRALEIGLVWRVVPHERLMEEAYTLASRLLRGAPLAQRATKEMAQRAGHLATIDALRFAETMRLAVAGSADAREGATAAVERRSPVWRGA